MQLHAPPDGSLPKSRGPNIQKTFIFRLESRRHPVTLPWGRRARLGGAGLQYEFGNYVLDVQKRELRRNNALRPVEPQVFDLLHFLIENRERVVSRDEIFRAVWRGRIVSDSVLGTRINAVRQAIGDDGTRQRLIRTIRGSGFRFVGPVSAHPQVLPGGKPGHLQGGLPAAPDSIRREASGHAMPRPNSSLVQRIRRKT